MARHRARDEDERQVLERVERELFSTDPWSRSSSLHVTGSAIVVDRRTSRVLLRWHDKLGRWLQVGGHSDDSDDSVFDLALREATEETGLSDLAPYHPSEGDPIHIVIVPVPANGHEPAHEHLDIRYVLATANADKARPESAATPLRWLDLDEAIALVGDTNLEECLERIRPLVN